MLEEYRGIETLFRKLTEQFLLGIIERQHELLTYDAENAGTYFLTVTVDSTGCTAEASFEIRQGVAHQRHGVGHVRVGACLHLQRHIDQRRQQILRRFADFSDPNNAKANKYAFIKKITTATYNKAGKIKYDPTRVCGWITVRPVF